MPTEFRRTADQSAAINGAESAASDDDKHYGKHAAREATRRKYAVLILCIPVLTGAYALMASQGCEDDDQLGPLHHLKNDFLETRQGRQHNTHNPAHQHRHADGGILHAGKGKHKHQKVKASHDSVGVPDWIPPPTSIALDNYKGADLGHSAARASGGSSCGSHGDCGIHGKCLADGTCGCAVLYEGERCERLRPFPSGKNLKKGKSLDFAGDMVLHQERMKKRDKLKVFLPGKEKDADKGHRVLSSGDELKRLVQILPKNDTILNAQVYDKCAVIGSSGIVLSYEHGKEIDTHDFVMRFNSAPTKGFEKHVGSFTTHRITNTQNWAFRESDDENLMIHLRAKSAIIGLFYNYRSKSRRKKEWIPHLWAFDPDYVEFVAHSLNFMATSGLYGIMMAMQRCREVNIYGFHVSTKQGALYHYYDVCDVPANPSRDGDEFRFVKALANAGFINFGEDCVLECHETQEVCDKCKREKNFVQQEMASTKHCNPKRVSEGHNIVPWASRRARSRFNRKHAKDPHHKH